MAMAECLEPVSSYRDAFLDEQQEEVIVLQSIFEDDLQIVERGDGHANICFQLTVKVNISFDIINFEAFIPARAPNYSSGSDLGSRPKDDKLENETCSDSSFNEDHISAQTIGREGSSLGEEENNPLPEPFPNSFSGRTKPGFTRSVSMQHWHVKADIQYLTPIHLTCTFSPLYPTECPPEFSLACLWLTKSQLQELQEKLMKLWTETPNLPIVFTWADWLKNYAYEYLRLGSHLVLKTQEDEATNGQSFEQSEGFSTKLETALLTIFEYDLEMQRQAFWQSKHLCEICFAERGGTEFHYLDECRHFFCTECLKAHCQLHVDGGNVLKLLCPGHDCKTKIPPDILRLVLDAEKLERWERLLFSKTLDVMGGVVYCPRCSLAVLVDEDEALRLGHCANCFYAFCTECYEPWHHGLPCNEEGDSDSDDEDSSKSQEEVHSSKGKKEVDSTNSREEVNAIAAVRRRSCQNCSVKKDKARFHYVHECGHFFCTECLKAHFQLNVDHGTVANIQCPNAGCKAAISVKMAREVLDKKKFKRYIAASRIRSCQNCSAKKDKAKFHYMYKCKHFFCTECLKAYLQWNIEGENVLNIRCPIPYCEAAISEKLLRELLDEKVFKQYKKLFRAKILENMDVSDVDVCPRCTVAVVVDEDESPTRRQCANCTFEFCTKCFEPWHYGKPCYAGADSDLDDEKNKKRTKNLLSKEEKSNEGKAGSPGMSVSSGRKETLHSKQKLRNLSFIRRMRQKGKYQCCPRCRMTVERIAGCDIMHCSQCSTRFCWRCGMEISRCGYFGHCRRSQGALPQPPMQLPPRETPAQEQLPVVNKQAEKANPNAKVQAKCCPRCHKRCLKEKNINHLKCWNCTTVFCYQCGKDIKGAVSMHFTAASLCAQHSDD